MKKAVLTPDDLARQSVRLRLVHLLSKFSGLVPDSYKNVFKPFSRVYSRIYRMCYSSIGAEILVRTPSGPYIFANYSDDVEREIANGVYEKDYVDIFCRKVKEGDVVIDAGAYIGYFSLLASRKVGDTGRVYAFEPVPRNYKRLVRNLGINKAENVRPYDFGLSNKNETLYFSVPVELPAEATLSRSNVTEISKNVKMRKNKVRVRLRHFDRFLREEGLTEVNIVKIDTEGMELRVLKGMKNTLRSNDLAVFIEIIPILIKRTYGSVVELVRFLADCGFKSIYSVKSDSEINISTDNVSRVVEFVIKDSWHNFVFEKRHSILGSP